MGYRFFTTSGRAVSYPFGYGLSYTSFQYSNAKVTSTKDGITASITVTNTGKNTGKEVVQLYVKAPQGCLPDKPVRELKAFGKTRELQPGERQTLTFKISSYELASFSEQQSQWETAAGQYDVQFAASSEDIRVHATFHLKKTLRWPTHHVLQRNDLWKSPTGLPAV